LVELCSPNLPGTSVSVADTASTGRFGDAVIIDGSLADGSANVFPAMTLINTSEMTGGPTGAIAVANFNWLSAQI
jgi:hypothetical protein